MIETLTCPVDGRLTLSEKKDDLSFSIELWGKAFTFSPDLIVELKKIWFESKLVPVGDILKHRRGLSFIAEQRTLDFACITEHEYDLLLKTAKKGLKTDKGFMSVEELTAEQAEFIGQMENQIDDQIADLNLPDEN